MNPVKALIMSIFLVTVLNIILSKNSKKLKKEIQWQHYLFGYFFVLYIMITLILVGLPSLWEWEGLLRFNGSIFNPHINFVLFKDGFDFTYILNIILFIPFGFLLPTLWEKYHNVKATFYYGLIFSFIIEISQLFTRARITDINDIMTNVVGTICGWLVFNILRKVFCKLANKAVVYIFPNDTLVIKLEPYLYIAIAMICVFFE